MQPISPDICTPCNESEFSRVRPHSLRRFALLALPQEISEQAIPISDIFPTGYFAANEAEVTSGDTRPSLVAAPFGLFAIPSAGLLGRRRISLPLTARRVVSMWLRA
jgi:threonine dehydrogenase-like Zn-dependent dehydrogenase